MPGLGTLRQLDLDHLDLRPARLLGEALCIEPALGCAAAEIAAADLPDQVSAVLPVVATDAAFAGVMREVALVRSAVQCQDRVGRQPPEAVRRDVEHRS